RPRSVGTISVLSRLSDVWMVPVADQIADQRAVPLPRLWLLSLAGRRPPENVTNAVVASMVMALLQLTPSALTFICQEVSPISPISAWPVQLLWKRRLAVSSPSALLILS